MLMFIIIIIIIIIFPFMIKFDAKTLMAYVWPVITALHQLFATTIIMIL